MPNPREKALLERINHALAVHDDVHASGHRTARGEVEPGLAARFRTAGLSLLEDMYGAASQHYKDFEYRTRANTGYDFARARGILDGVKHQVESGWLASTAGLIAGELFGDFIEMAQHLWDEGYKDAAAVIAGSSLEAHLRRVAMLAGIPLEVTTPKGDVVPKKAETLNADLARAGAYGKTEQKQVTAWLGIRNDAAHGEYPKVLNDMVAAMIMGIRDFIVRHPA